MVSVVLHRDRKPSVLPLLLLAPFPLDSRVWAGVLDRLPGDVITVEPPGFGGALADGTPSLESYADAVRAALAAEGIDRYVVAGNSMGGYAAMALAEQAPERIAGIGLIGTKSTADTAQARAGRLAMAASAESGTPAADLVGPMREKLISDTTRRDDPVAAAALEEWLAQAPLTGIAWAQRAMAARPDRTGALAALAAAGIPGLVLHGAADPLMGADAQTVMADAVKIKVTQIPDRGHLLPLEAPRETAVALRGLWGRAGG